MFAVDKCGRITLWNDAMAGLCGIGSSETCGKLALGEVFGPKGFLRCVKKDGVSDLLTEMSAAILSVQEPGCAQAETLESQGAIEACFGKGDSNLHVDVALRCHVQLGASGEVVGTFFSVQDLTMPKALEKALALQMASEVAAESTERHISILCHEIRNPVNGIMATVQAMEELVVADHFAIDIADFQDLTMTMLYCTNQLRRTVDSILDINKISEGKLKTSPAPLRPKDVVESVLNKLRKPAQERGLTLLSEINPPSLGNTHLLGDEARIQQILSYFCWNIIDYPRAQKCLRLLVECEDGERPGFKRVFWKVVDPLSDVCREGQQRFTSTLVEQDQAETYKESGLGLSVCRGLAEIMDGSVRCTKLDDSVTFTLELDLEVTAEADSGLLPGDESPVSAPKAPGAGALPAHSPAVSYPESSGRSKDSEVQLAMNSQLPPQRCAEEHQATPSQGYPPQAGAGHRDRQGMEAYVPSNFHRQFGHAHSSNWSCCAIREVVDSASVAVLAQVGDGRTSRQHWGSARVVDGNVGSAIAAAYEDAVDRASSLFTSSSAGSCAAPPARMAPPAPWVWNRVSHPGPLMNAAYAASARQWLFTPAGYTTGMQLKPAPLNEPAAVPPLHVYPAVPSCGAMATPVGRSAPARQETVATQHSATSPQSHLSPAQYVQAQVVDPALETQAATPQGSQHKTPTVSVPRTDSKSDVTSLSSPARHAKSPLLEGRSTPRILAVDDDPINIKMLCRNLVREGLDVTTGEDGRDVVRMCVNEGRRFDLLLLDENMRHMNGSVAAAVLRKHEQHNGLERMPIIATTGNSSSQDILRYVSCGMDGILSKPINMRDLVKNIIAFLECQQKIHEMRQNNRLADICSGSSVVIQDNEIFRESLLFGELEIFGVVKEGMAEAAEKARCMVCNHENESC